MSPDHINAAFEFGGSIILWLNVIRLAHDKQVRGVHWAPVLFFFAWGLWNLYFYPAVDAMWSFYAGVGVAVVNGVWLSQMLYYKRK